MGDENDAKARVIRIALAQLEERADEVPCIAFSQHCRSSISYSRATASPRVQRRGGWRSGIARLSSSRDRGWRGRNDAFAAIKVAGIYLVCDLPDAGLASFIVALMRTPRFAPFV
jgi:hypothetical protein